MGSFAFMIGSNVSTALSSLTSMIGGWAPWIMAFAGSIMVIVAIVKIAKGLISHGKGQTNWVLNIFMLLFGAGLIGASTIFWNALKSSGSSVVDDFKSLL